jgi:membrane protein YdbS with pleckstrin-like domain
MILLYLDPGSGSILLQLLAAAGIALYAYFSAQNKKFINYVVLVGGLLGIASCLFLPGIVFSKLWGFTLQSHQTIFNNGLLGSYLCFLILILMFLRWKWRGILWIVLGSLGAAFTPYYAHSYNWVQWIILITFLIILGGSIWDLINNNKRISKTMISEDSEDDE